MKISASGQIQSKTVSKTSKKRGTSGTAFTSELPASEAASPASSVGGAAPLASVDALLSLQEVPDATTGRSRGLKRADEMLEALEEIRKGILLGAIPVARLKSLAALSRNSREKLDDKRLTEILTDIELRAEVELAKLGV